jgi:isopenicillin N synthase-like dioxygenase
MSVPVLDVALAYYHAVVDAADDPRLAVKYDVIDTLTQANGPLAPLVQALLDACETVGFFYVSGYTERQLELERLIDASMREFFSLPVTEKLAMPMSAGGRAWRGYFPVGAELTSGKPDLKEGIYFGRDLPSSHEAVRRSLPLHGPNLYPRSPANMGPLVREYMHQCAVLGHLLLALLARGLQLPASYFADGLVKDHLPLFRAFHYPPRNMLDARLVRASESLWGVGEHTDYGLLTLLKQDDVGGLEVRALDGTTWVPVPPIDGTLVVNLGDILESITAGLLRSTPHRVRMVSETRMRISLPFFFDPGFESVVQRVPLNKDLRNRAADRRAERAARGFTRWDREIEPPVAGVPYGQYLVTKVSRVFPDLATAKL